LRLPHENRACKNLCFLTNIPTQVQFMLITYIAKMKRANPRKMDLPYWKTISQII